MGNKKSYIGNFLSGNFSKIALLMILASGAFLSMAFFYGPSWINGSDNYIYTWEAHMFAQGNFQPLGLTLGDNVKLLLIGGITLFFSIFRYSLLTASLFGVMCFLLTIIAVYMIGKELYSKAAGLFSAFLYSVFPLVLVESSNVGDDIPMAFLVALSILLVIKGLKSVKRQSAYLFTAGFLSLINVLIVPEALIGSFFIFGWLCIDAIAKRNHRSIFQIFNFTSGAIAAILVIFALGFLISGNPLHIIDAYSANFNSYQGTSPAFSAYYSSLFSNNLSAFAGNPHGFLRNTGFNMLAYGFFGIALALSVLYLTINYRRAAIVPAAWLIFMLLYMGFGTMSITTYIPLILMIRYTVIFVPAIALLIGIALADIIKVAKGKIAPIAYSLVVASLIALAVSSVIIAAYLNYSQYKTALPLLEIGGYINSLPSNTNIQGPADVPWLVYTSQNNTNSLGYVMSENTCKNVTALFSFKPGSYFIGNLTDPSSCNMTEVFQPSYPQWLSNYTAFDNIGLNFYNVNVYKYQPGD
ncbi:MAG: glycosyltransferase family 39 protein [Candidatus Micrarchaeales archaeon]|nr:glycosyltransferase family 39 protein [Candidatus Micrarchaeales archaeon]